MALPTTTTFDLLDWDGGVKITDPVQGVLVVPETQVTGAASFTRHYELEMESGADVGGVLAEVGGAWTCKVVALLTGGYRVEVIAGAVAPDIGDVATDGLRLYTVASIVGALRMAPGSGLAKLRVPITFLTGASFEFRVEFASLPASCLTGSFYAGVENDEASAFLSLGQNGMGWSSSPSNGFHLFDGTEDLAQQPDMTYRIVGDPENSRLLFYATPTPQVESVGHILRRVVPIQSGTLSGADSVLVQVSSCVVFLKTMRATSTALVPNERPVANPGDDEILPLGDAMFLNGSASYDPEGEDLTYRWILVQTPLGSSASLVGATQASRQFVWTDGDYLELTARTAGSSGNLIYLDLQENPGGGVTVAVSGSAVTVAFDPGVSTVQDVLDALTAAGSSVPFTAAMTGDATKFVVATRLTLQEGADGSGVKSSFRPDKLGAYRVGLIVNDGVLDSSMVVKIIDVAESNLVMGHVPDGGIVWSAISDVWQLASGRAPVATAFAGLMQVASALQMELWQYDDGKNIETIGRRFLRRWVRFPARTTSEDFSPTVTPNTSERVTARITVADELQASSKMLRFGPWTNEDTLVGSTNGDRLVVWPTWDEPRLVATDEIYPLLQVAKGALVNTGSTLYLEDSKGSFLDLGVSQGMYVQAKDAAGAWSVLRIRSVTRDRLTFNPRLATSFPAGKNYVSYCVGGLVVLSDAMETFTLIDSGPTDGYGTGTSFQRRGSREFSSSIEAGDILRVYPKDGSDPIRYVLDSPPLASPSELTTVGAITSITGVAWDVIRSHIDSNVLVHRVPVAQMADGETPPSVDDTAVLETAQGQEISGHVAAVSADDEYFAVFPKYRSRRVSVKRFHRVYTLPHDETLLEVPRLQSTPLDENPLLRGRDFSITTDSDSDHPGSIEMAEVAAGFLTFDGTTYTTDIDLDMYGVVPGATLLVPMRNTVGDAAVFGPALVTAVDGQTVELTWMLDEFVSAAAFSNIAFVVSLYGANNLTPVEFWAEMAYYSNSDMVENNFGVAVGLPEEAYADNELHLDYLSAVRALWFVFRRGPTVRNMELGTKVFLGLPFAEYAGTVSTVEPDYSDDLVRVIIESEEADGTPFFKTYFFPSTLDLATNATTNLPYTVGDAIDRFTPLCTGTEVRDHVTDTDWIKRWLKGPEELKKYHTFLVNVDMTGHPGVDPAMISRLVDFVRRAKPDDADCIVVGVHNISDRIDVEDSISFRTRMTIGLEPYTTTDMAEWQPTNVETGYQMRSGFTHRFGDYDGEGLRPYELWADYSTYGRELLWVKCSARVGTFDRGEMLIDSVGRYAVIVEYDGPGYVLVRHVNWVYDIGVTDNVPYAAGDAVGRNVSASDLMAGGGPFHAGVTTRWTGHVIASAANLLRVGLFPGSRMPPCVGDVVTVPNETVTSVAQRSQPPAVLSGHTLVGTTNPASTFDVDEVVEYPDHWSDVGRRHEVGPETQTRARLRFPVVADTQKIVNVTGTIVPGDHLRENVADPTWFLTVERWADLGGGVHQAYCDHPRVRKYTVSVITGWAEGDLLRSEQDPFWSGRILHISGKIVYAKSYPNTALYGGAPWDEPVLNDWLTNGTVSSQVAVDWGVQQDPAASNVTVGHNVTGTLGSAGVVAVFVAADGRWPESDLGLISDDYETFQLPTAVLDTIVVEVPEASHGFIVGERVQYQWGLATVIDVGPYYLVLHGAAVAPHVGSTIKTIRGMVVVAGVWTAATESSTTVVAAWEEKEYSVPNVRGGRYFWGGTMLQEDYLLRLYYSPAFAISIGEELVDVDVAHAVPRYRFVAMTNSIATTPPLPLSTHYVDVLPVPGFPRSMPYHSRQLERYAPAATGNLITIRPEGWAMQWVPGGTDITDAESGRNVKLVNRDHPLGVDDVA